MRCYIDEIMKKIGFPAEAREFFLRLYDRFSPEGPAEFEKLQPVYFMNVKTDKTRDEINTCVEKKLALFAKYYGYDVRSIHMLFLLYCTKELHARYRAKGLSDELYYAIVTDIRYKVIECKKYSDVWGSMNFTWFHRHFLIDRFALGRFQFEDYGFLEESYDFDDIHLKKGDKVINIHIPSSGSMTDEARLDSYKKAYNFFKNDDDKYIVFVCNSWLLYPENDKIFPKGSNLYKFLKEFDIIASTLNPYNAFTNAWRVFYKDFEGDISVLPQNTTLEKNIAAWLGAGNKIGGGYGVMVFDGEKIVNNSVSF